jgi:hypothetical protein
MRDDLQGVGVTRAILFEAAEDNVQELRFHDARATFCTWARRAGERIGQKETGKMIDATTAALRRSLTFSTSRSPTSVARSRSSSSA